jgi:TRAP-type C4-dicarboxylate transport system substrate-binding protein
MAKILPTMSADKFPVDGIGIFSPVNVKTYRPSQAWLELYNEFPEAQAQYKDTPLLGYAFMPCAGLGTIKGKTVTKWEDAKGLKAPGAGPAPESRLKAVGIVPVSIAPPDAYMAFKTGALDIVATSLMTLKDFKWGDVLPNVSLVNINSSPWSYVMSAKAWNSLPPDIQQVFKDLIPWLTELNDKVQYQNEQTALRDFGKEFGTTFITVSQAELDRWAEVDSSTLDAYIRDFVTAKGLPGDKMKSEFLRLYKKYGGAEYAFK